MAINLQKGQAISLDKDTYDLSTITIGLGWDVMDEKAMAKPETKGLFSKLFSNATTVKTKAYGSKTRRVVKHQAAKEMPTMPYDLDAIAFLLNDKGKIPNIGTRSSLENGQVVDFVGGDIIFYNNPLHRDGSVHHTGDNRTGEGEGDDEQIVVKLDALPGYYQRLLFMACIYQGSQREQHFGMLENAYIRAVDAQGREIVRYNLSNGEIFNQKRSVIFAEVYRKGNLWKFGALGDALETDRFGEVLKNYI